MEGTAQKSRKRRISNKNMRKINGIICMLAMADWVHIVLCQAAREHH